MRARNLASAPALDALVEAAAFGDGAARVRAAGRLMTLLEQAPHRLPELYRTVPEERWQRPRLVLGITGAPGSGKSTLVDATVFELRRREPAWRIGVVAVDPSSPFTGGAVLGDRVRMMRHATDPAVFIRSLATRGHLGGLSLGVKGVMRVMTLIGCDVVIIETVGVGQSEVEVARIAETVAVVLAPGAGDSVQMLKAGLMEVGDLFIINKADTPGADALHRTLLQALSLADADSGTDAQPGTDAHTGTDAHAGTDAQTGTDARAGAVPRRPDVLLASATTGDGIPALVEQLLQHAADPARDHGRRDVRQDARLDVREALLESARRRLERALDAEPGRLDDILSGTLPLDAAVARLFEEQLNHE
jgi:LAO/AO transport system kinase